MKQVINFKAQKENWEEAKDKAFNKLNSKSKIDGFRPGKAPRNIFERNYPGQITMEAADILIDQEYRRIITEDKILPIIEPKIDIVKITDEELEVNFTFITEPKVELGEYKNLKIKKPTVKVTKEEVNNKIDNLLKGYAELIVKENDTVENNDIAVIDFEGFKDDIAFEGGKGENYSLEIGSNTFIPGFEDGVIGMKKGETKDLKLTFPKDYGQTDLAGKEVIFKVTVNEIKTKVVPELNEEFFEDLNMEDIKTKEDLEKKMKEEIKHQKEHEAEHKYIDDLLDQATSNMKIDLDEELIDYETNHMYSDFMNKMAMQGINEEIYLQYAGTTKEDIMNHMKEEATKRLKNSYLLNAIIQEEKIELKDSEIDKEIEKIANEHHISIEEVIKAFGSKEALSYDLKVQKAIELMKETKETK